MDKVGIITYHFAQNYGAVLQCYALQRYLILNGYNVLILNAITEKQKNNNSLFNKRKGISNIYVNVCLLPFVLSRIRKKNRFEQFVAKYLNCTDIVTNRDQLLNLIVKEKFNFLISGSDQVWNPYIPDFEDLFFFPFETSVTKIGYSISIGRAEYKDLIKFEKYIKDFSKIALREKSSKEIIRNFTNEELSITIDPVLLLEKKEWNNIIKHNAKLIIEKYIFCYFLDKKHMDKNLEIAKYISKFLGIRIKCISMHFDINSFKDCFVHDAGPSEFLELISNADFVLTDGYHGTVFSTIFNKNFFSIIHNKNSNDSRIKDYLESLGLKHRIIYDIDDINNNSLNNIDYDEVNIKIKKIPQESYSFLKKSLSTF